jgi:hypothetical protein
VQSNSEDVLDGNLPSDSNVATMVNVQSNSITDSFDLIYLDACHYPPATPTPPISRSPSLSPLASISQTPTELNTPFPTEPDSPFPAESNSPFRTESNSSAPRTVSEKRTESDSPVPTKRYFR